MAPLRSPILSALARTKFQRPSIQQFRHASTAGSRSAASPTWESPTRRVAGTVMMYVPVVAVVMFWPYAVTPVMDLHLMGSK